MDIGMVHPIVDRAFNSLTSLPKLGDFTLTDSLCHLQVCSLLSGDYKNKFPLAVKMSQF